MTKFSVAEEPLRVTLIPEIKQVLIVAEGSTSRLLERDRNQVRDELSALAQAAQTAGSILGAAGVELLDFPDNRLDSLDRLDLIKRIEESVERYQPACVYVHHAGDVNVDHRRLHEALVTACRPTPGHVVKRLLSFEVASSTEWQPPGSAPAFHPNWFVDISDHWERKREALVAYATEMRDWPHACSLRLSSTWRVGAAPRWASKQRKPFVCCGHCYEPHPHPLRCVSADR